MAPVGQKKHQQTTKKNVDIGVPALKAPGPSGEKTQYQALQENEVMVMQAIYGDDFTEHKATNSAWQVWSINSHA